VFFMKKFGKDKIALFLACTSLLSDKASAMNMGKTQNQQPVAAVGGGRSLAIIIQFSKDLVKNKNLQ